MVTAVCERVLVVLRALNTQKYMLRACTVVNADIPGQSTGCSTDVTVVGEACLCISCCFSLLLVSCISCCFRCRESFTRPATATCNTNFWCTGTCCSHPPPSGGCCSGLCTSFTSDANWFVHYMWSSVDCVGLVLCSGGCGNKCLGPNSHCAQDSDGTYSCTNCPTKPNVVISSTANVRARSLRRHSDHMLILGRREASAWSNILRGLPFQRPWQQSSSSKTSRCGP